MRKQLALYASVLFCLVPFIDSLSRFVKGSLSMMKKKNQRNVSADVERTKSVAEQKEKRKRLYLMRKIWI